MNYEAGTDTDLVLSNMIEVEFVEDPQEDFNVVRETLQRMGVSNNRTHTLYQTAHIFQKRGRYYICHFKELFAVDGKSANLSETDVGRRNLIAKYLMEWDLIKPITDNWQEPMCHPKQLKIIRFQEKIDWTFEAKYNIGNNHNRK